MLLGPCLQARVVIGGALIRPGDWIYADEVRAGLLQMASFCTWHFLLRSTVMGAVGWSGVPVSVNQLSLRAGCRMACW
jgi:hypothetical protein